jgi:peptidoglycan/LPS O-acetylase OafA/YrhL
VPLQNSAADGEAGRLAQAERPPLPALTGLRGIAAICIVLSHGLAMIVPVPDPVPQWYGYLTSAPAALGMPLFFVLSGFVIHYNYSQRVTVNLRRGSIQFFVARFARLYPLYLTCLVADLAYRYSYDQLPTTTAAVLPYYLTLTQSWVYRVFGDRALIYQSGPVMQVSWSISTEWFFYLCYPLVCLGLARIRRCRSLLLCVAAVIIGMATIVGLILSSSDAINRSAVLFFGPVADAATNRQDSFIQWLVAFSPFVQLPHFLLGCLCAALYVATASADPASPHDERIGLAVTVAAISTVLVIFGARFLTDQIPWVPFAFGPPLALLIFCSARYGNAVIRGLRSRPLVFCGEVSYSIYMLHLLLVLAFRWESAAVREARVLIADGLRMVITVLSTIGLSFITYSLIEMPARHWLTCVLARRLTPPVAADRQQAVP